MYDYFRLFVYNQNENKNIEFNRIILIDSSIFSLGYFNVTKEYIILYGGYINKWNISDGLDFLFLTNHEGFLLQKT